ncbi:MAG TPA: hypothetical protein VGQ83_41240 [Polyangia bacterium]
MSRGDGGRRAPLALAIAGAVGVVSAIAAVAAGLVRSDHFYHAYLLAFLVWLAVPLGSLTILGVHHVSGGRWGLGAAPPARAAVLTLPLLAAAFVPLALGLQHLYPWARVEEVAADFALRWKTPYLNLPFFLVRAVVAFLLWSLLALVLQRWSRRYAARPDPSLRVRLQALAAGGLVLHAVLSGFAAIDWIGALAKEWYSSVFGLQIFVGQALSALAVAALATGLAAPRMDAGDAQVRGVRQDIGSLLLTLVVLYAYLAFSNGYVIWIGNLSHEISWFEPRVHGGWKALGLLLMVIHFGVPFWALLFRRVKRHPAPLFAVVVVICAARLLDQAWIVLPFGPRGAGIWLLSLVLLAGLGGLWLAAFLWFWGREPRPLEATAS